MAGRVKVEGSRWLDRDDIGWEIPEAIVDNEEKAYQLQLALIQLNKNYEAASESLDQLFHCQRDTLVSGLPKLDRFAALTKKA